MKHLIEAVYVNGSFRPKERPDLADGQEVRLIVVTEDSTVEEAQEMAQQVYNDLSRHDLREIENVALTSRGYVDEGTIDRAE